MLDGIDGSGKGTVIKAWKEHLINSGRSVFDLIKYWEQHGKYPEYKEVKTYKYIFSGEPSYVGIGKIIRQELLQKEKGYPSQALAEAFSLDRFILYKKIILPALKDKKIIIQDRGISSSLAYQTVDDLKIKNIINLSGNKIALEYSPDKLILLNVKASEAINRLTNRLNKQDNSIFEKLDFLNKLDKVYKSKKYQKNFTKRKTEIIQLNGNQKIDIMKAEAIELLKKILNNSHTYHN